jgi:tetratricopeptide (TPR) repeat protein
MILLMLMTASMLQTRIMCAQNRTDSLKQLISKGGQDPGKLSVLYAVLAREYYLRNNDSCIFTGHVGLKLAEKAGSRDGIIKNCLYLGLYLMRNDSLLLSKKYFLRANKLRTVTTDPVDKMKILNGLGYISELQSDFAGALNYYLQGQTTAVEAGRKEWKADFLNNIAVLYSSAGMYRKCIDLYEEAMDIYLVEKDSSLYANTLINIGEAFRGLKMTDSALFFYNRAFPIQKRLNNQYGLANLYLGFASIKMEEKRYPEALIFIRNSREMIDALDSSFHGSSLFIRVEMEQKMAFIFQKMKLYLKADSLYKIAWQHARQGSFLQYETDAIKGLSEVFELRGQADSALKYAKLHHKYADSLWKVKDGQKIALTELEFNVKNEKEQQRVDEVKRESLWIRNRLLFILTISGIFSIAIVLLLLYLLQRSKTHRLSLMETNLKLEKMNLQLDKEHLEKNIDQKNKEAMSQSMSLVEKNEKMAEISSRLLGFMANTGRKDDSQLQILVHDLQSHYSDRVFEEFNAHFLKVHPDFSRRLSLDFPGLSANDIRLCMFIKLNLTNKETAQIMHKTEHSIKIARHRLRKKLFLGPEVNLAMFFNKY